MIVRWIFLGTVALLLSACLSFSTPLPSLEGTEPAPDIILPTPAGELLSLSDFRGQVVFVNFWGTYCPPCVAEMPDLQKTYEILKNDGFVIYSINAEESPQKVQAFAKEHGITFPIVISEDATVNPVFALKHMPTTWFIDQDGVFRGRIEGQMSADMAIRIARDLLTQSSNTP